MRLSKENYLKLVTGLHSLFEHQGKRLIFTFWCKTKDELKQLFGGIHNQCENLEPNLKTLLVLIELLCGHQSKGPTAQHIRQLGVMLQPAVHDSGGVMQEEAGVVAQGNEGTQGILENTLHTNACEGFITYMSYMACMRWAKDYYQKQGNHTTPSYVSFTNTERLNGDHAKNHGDSTVQSDMKHRPFTVTEQRGLPRFKAKYQKG